MLREYVAVDWRIHRAPMTGVRHWICARLETGDFSGRPNRVTDGAEFEKTVPAVPLAHSVGMAATLLSKAVHCGIGTALPVQLICCCELGSPVAVMAGYTYC